MAYEKSALTDDLENCYICGRSPVQFHHVFFGNKRADATADNFFIPLCWQCHLKVHNEPSQRLNYSLKKWAQAIYEETHTRDEFIKRYGKSYL